MIAGSVHHEAREEHEEKCPNAALDATKTHAGIAVVNRCAARSCVISTQVFVKFLAMFEV